MKWEYLLTLVLSVIIGYLMYLVMAPFLIPIFWAIIFVILFYPYYIWLTSRFRGRRSLASLAACTSIALFLIVPMALLGSALAAELVNLYAWAEDYIRDISARAATPGFFLTWAEKYLGGYVDLETLDIRGMLATVVREAAGFAGQGIRGFVRSFAGFVLNLFLAFFTMYFLFKDGDKLFKIVKDLVPVSPEHKEEIIRKNRGVIYATIYGGVLVGIIQAILGGIALWYLGIPAALVLTFVMFLTTFIPNIGASLVWAPVAVYLAVNGDYVGAVGLSVWGIFVIGLVDNFMRPYLVSGRTNLHPLLLFFSILGAMNAFGLIGIIAGPLIVSIGQAMIEFYHEYVTKKNEWAG
ncbi:MAG: AI-2E family transporter [Deltaproteobacteria bacterium]|nr:AI-2E family transporter [Deltaproteobacteria bacterium]MBZ0220081.1 AI-2E family transporter [Deltaproteobacteria bacterium]